MTSKILEDLADTRLARPEFARHECRCENEECNDYGNILRCYMELRFREECPYFIRFFKAGGLEE